MTVETTFLGLKLYELLTLLGIIIGPIAAVMISLWIEERRKKNEAKLITLRLLLTTRDLPSDPTYQVAVKLVPVEFNDSPAVLVAHREFLEAANASTDGRSDDEIKAISDRTSVKLVRLLYEMSQAAGLKLRETDIQTGAFGTRGFFYRDALLQDSQRAMRDVANILWMQTRMMAGETFDEVVAQPSGDNEPPAVSSPSAEENK